MGYTEFVLGVDLHRETPKNVIDILKFMTDRECDLKTPQVDDHPLFKTERWEKMLVNDSGCFQGGTCSVIGPSCDPLSSYSVSIRCNLKNYDSEIELFLNWLASYITCVGFVGTMRCEDSDDPTLIYYDYYLSEFELHRFAAEEKCVLDDEWVKANAHVCE